MDGCSIVCILCVEIVGCHDVTMSHIQQVGTHNKYQVRTRQALKTRRSFGRWGQEGGKEAAVSAVCLLHITDRNSCARYFVTLKSLIHRTRDNY